jgi:hypothetical protein
MQKKLFLFSLVILWVQCSFGQASWEKFGQNRVQYRTFDWGYYDSTHFRTFFYKDGKPNGLYALNVAEQELSNIVNLMGGKMGKKLNLIIYNSFSDFRQSNLGRKNEETNQANGGKVEMIGENIPIYFNGDHTHLRKQIRKGIASVIKENMLFGESLKDALKNSIKMNLPPWYTEGYVAHIADDWTAEMTSEVASQIDTTKPKQFLNLAIAQPNLFGHSFWYFITSQFGENYVANLLYLTRYRMGVNRAVEVVLKISFEAFLHSWQLFYLNQQMGKNDLLASSLGGREILSKIKTKPNAEYSHFSPSPSGRDLAFVEKLDGQFVVKINDLKFGNTSEMLSGGVRAAQELADPNYPILSWSPSGNKLAVLYQRKNKLNLRIFTADNRKMENRIIAARKIDRITGMCFMPDEYSLAITAVKKGQSDLYKLTIAKSRIEPITNDLFDDKSPSYIQNEVASGILFLSNRDNPFVGENSKSDAFNPQFNLYLYSPSKGTILTQLSNTNESIQHPIQWGKDEFAYLQHEGGKLERKIVKIEKRLQLGDTFSVRNFTPAPFTIIQQEYIHQAMRVIEVAKIKNEYVVFASSIDTLKKFDKIYQDTLSPIISTLDSSETLEALLLKMPKYATPFEDDTNENSYLTEVFTRKNKLKSKYQLFSSLQYIQKPKKYIPTFYPDFLQSSLDNTLLFTRYQPFDFSGGQFDNPPLSGFVTTTLTDVMEDYRIRGGARMGTDFSSIDYFVQLKNYRRRVDWGLLYYRHRVLNRYDQRDASPPFYSPLPVFGKVTMDYIQGEAVCPIDVLHSVRAELGLRMDRIRMKATDKYSIAIPEDQQYWVVNRYEFVYDNTVSPLLNIWKGTRFKIFAEYQYKFNGTTKGFYNLGYDARTYIKLYKNIILASRLAGSHSGGNAKILYQVGGVDNDVNPKQDLNASIDLSQNYAFVSLATNMRGYRQGFKNGNSFMLLNEEIRFPICNTFFKRQIKSGFIRHLQLIAFADLGSAWKGILPNEDNIATPSVIKQNPVTVTLLKSQSDVGLGYGLGFRSKLFGYFVRCDFAWNIEGIRKPITHISLATDF